MKPTSKEKNLLYCIVIVLLIEAILFYVGNNKLDLAFINQENKITQVQNAVSNISVQAQAVSIYDETINRKIYGKDDDISMPLASLTKIMTVITALDNHQINDLIPISLDAIKQEGDYDLSAGEEFKIQDLAEFTLVGSSNDGAYALSQSSNFFLQKMNIKARKIGMQHASFFNFTGLDIGKKLAGAYASADDVNIMAMYALKAYPEIFGASMMPAITIQSVLGIKHTIQNTDDVLNKIPNILLSKTGYTTLAGGNLAVIYRNNYEHTIAITVLGSTMDGRFSDMEKIINALQSINYGN
jgi:D-alanyl-D-alanine carboxypeptidase